jgi:hypothetical protein
MTLGVVWNADTETGPRILKPVAAVGRKLSLSSWKAHDEEDTGSRRFDGLDRALVGALPLLPSECSSRLHSTHFQWALSSLLAMRKELRWDMARFPLRTPAPGLAGRSKSKEQAFRFLPFHRCRCCSGW